MKERLKGEARSGAEERRWLPNEERRSWSNSPPEVKYRAAACGEARCTCRACQGEIVAMVSGARRRDSCAKDGGQGRQSVCLINRQ